MSFRYTITPDRLILIRFEGSVSTAELISASSIVSADERYVHGLDGLVDLTRARVAISVSEINTLVDLASSGPRHGNGRWAVVVKGPAATAVAMLYQQKMSREDFFSLFCTLEAAAAFLGRPIDPDFPTPGFAA